MSKKKLFREEELKKMGFTRRFVPKKESGEEEGFTYYSLKLTENLILVSGSYDSESKEVTVTSLESKRKLSEGFIKACIEEFK